MTVEAAAARRASLVTDVEGSREMVPPDSRLVNKVKPGFVDGLARALIEWFADPVMTRAEGTRFFNYHRDRHSVATMGSKYLKVYCQITKKPSRPVTTA